MRKIAAIIFLIPLLISSFFAQEESVANFDNEQISSEEYLKRFELTPRVRSSAKIDTQKTHFLYTLIAEKLWAKEARNQNLDTLYSYKQYVNNLEKMMVRDALFKEVIESKISVTEDQIQKALAKKKYELRLKFMFSNSRTEINSLYSKLENTSIDSLLKNRSELAEQVDPITVIYGQMNEALEDTLFNLQVGEYTDPIFNEIGWVIYYLADKRELSAANLGDYQSQRSEVIKILGDRQRQEYVNEYLASLLSNIKADTDGELFHLLAEKLSELLTAKYYEKTFENYILYEDDIIRLIKSVDPNIASQDFIKFEKNPVTFKEFLYYIYFSNFQSPGKDIQTVRSSLSSVVRDFIGFEVVAREGYKRQLNLLPEVQDELDMWRDNFLSQYLKNTYNSEARVSQSELNDYLSQQSDSDISTKFVSITEAKLSSLEQAQHIILQLRFNYRFEDILEAMNFPQSSIIKSPEPQPISSFGDLAEIIDDMSEGDVYGPIVRSNGYSIIKLNKVEKRELTGDERNKLQVDTQKEVLFYKKLGKVLNEKTIEFAKKYNLEINEQVLNGIKVTEIPTLIYRYYGFGGQTVAAPFLNLFYDWYYQYKSEKENPL